MNPTANKRAGAKYETDLVSYMREKGFEADRLRLTGKEDEGDIFLRIPWMEGGVVVEAKREKGFSLATWVKEAQVERGNYMAHRNYGKYNIPPTFVVIHHARGKAIGQGYVTTTLDEYLRWR